MSNIIYDIDPDCAPVTCHITGGLGNQLFQIFTTIAFAMQNKRTYQFGNFPTPVNRPTYWHTFFKSILPTIITSQDYDAKYNNNQMVAHIRRPDHHYIHLPDASSIPRDHPIYLHGYFQSYHYFQKEFALIAQILNISHNRSLTVQKINQQIPHIFKNDTQCWTCSMHFRIGDYVHATYAHTILQLPYYIHALDSVLRAKFPDNNNIIDSTKYRVRILYFGENENRDFIYSERIQPLQKHFESDVYSKYVIEWVEMPNSYNVNKTRNNDSESKPIYMDIEPWEHMCVMSYCDAHILANSTFSLWAAYLNTFLRTDPSTYPVVCYPKQWFGPIHKQWNISDMFLPEWIFIS